MPPGLVRGDNVAVGCSAPQATVRGDSVKQWGAAPHRLPDSAVQVLRQRPWFLVPGKEFL